MTVVRMTEAEERACVGAYGSEWRRGVLVEHVWRLGEERVRVLASGRPVVVASDGAAVPVVCAELVAIATEDGPSTGRCGAWLSSLGAGACDGHAAELAAWRGMSEPERAAWERNVEEVTR